jgi:hypothetical protein
MNCQFATLGELSEAGLIHPRFASESSISHLVYTNSDISAKTFCVQATRSDHRKAYKDFIVCEDGIIRYYESKTPQRLNRGEGESISGIEADPSPTPTP